MPEELQNHPDLQFTCPQCQTHYGIRMKGLLEQYGKRLFTTGFRLSFFAQWLSNNTSITCQKCKETISYRILPREFHVVVDTADAKAPAPENLRL